jgi:hypothetical protein
MQVVLNVPQQLQGQQASGVFDPGAVGVARGEGPSGPLGSSITLGIGFLSQGLLLGCTLSSVIYG